MQLSFDGADRLVELVEARRGPVPAERRGPLALRARVGPDGDRAGAARRCRLGRRTARVAWRRGRARRSTRRRPAARARLVRRLRPRDHRSLACPLADRRDRRAAGGGARGRRHVRDPRQPGRAAADGDHRPDGDRPGRRARSTVRRPRRAALPLVRRRRRPRRAQRALRHGLPRPRRRAADGPARRGAGRRHGLARPAAAERADEAVRPRAPLALLRHVGRAVSPGARRCRGDRRDPDRPDRPRAGARRRDGGRSRRAVGATRPTPPRQALARGGGPTTPGTYVFRDANGQALYVGRARNLSARLRSYFSGERQRPAVEAALGALARIDWQPCGSELEAALDELRLLRELRPPANARGTRPDRHVYLRRRGARWICGTEPTPHGPISGRSLARRAAQALDGFEGDDPRDALPGAAAPPAAARGRPALRGRRAAARPDRGARAGRRPDRRARAPAERCAPASSCPRSSRGWCGRSSSRAASSRAAPCRAAAARSSRSRRASSEVDRHLAADLEATAADELLLLATFMRRPAPELRVVAARARRDPRGRRTG